MSAQGLTVALTRSAAENRTMASALAVHGVAIVDVPMIEIVVAEGNFSALESIIPDLHTFQWLVFTSANGVRAFDAVHRHQNDPVSINDQMRIAVVGPATRAAFTETVFGRTLAEKGELDNRLFMPPAATAADLVRQFPLPATSDDRVLAIVGQLADDTITAGLKDKGYVVERVDAYQNVQPQQTPDISSVDVVALFSPSAVDRFCALYGNRCPAVCIGPRTAAQATSRGLTVVAVADPHTEGAVLDLLLTFSE